MSSLNFFETNSQSSHLTVLKLQDDGSNWADYAPRLQKAMGARGLWRHVEGKATVPKPYELVNGIQVLQDGKTKATEVLNIGSFEHRKLNRIGKDYIITIRICTVVVVLFFTRFQGAHTALAKCELHWYLPNRVRQIPTQTSVGWHPS